LNQHLSSLTGASSTKIVLDPARDNAGRKILAYSGVGQGDGASATAILATALRPDGKIGEGGLAGNDVAAGSDFSGRAESSGKKSGKGSDSELHIGDGSWSCEAKLSRIE
jgi:hypothetical protein